MGATKELIREVYYLEAESDYVKENWDTFNNKSVKIIRVGVKNEDFKDDETHKTYLKEYIKAKDNLRNYEYDVRHGNIKRL